MIRELTDMPAGVIGFQASGRITSEDFDHVVIPVLEGAASQSDMRFVVVIPGFRGMTGRAMWQDLKLASKYFRKWKRIALITDINWMRRTVAVLGRMPVGEIRHFPMAAQAEAITWAAA